MPHRIEPSILRILSSKQTVGTGFLVAANLAVTCYHVVLQAGMDGDRRVRVQFSGEKQHGFAKVLEEYFNLDHDIALLELESVPNSARPLRLGRASESQLRNPVYIFGYAIAAGEQGIGGGGEFIRQGENLIQLQIPEAYFGHSGAPVFDEKRQVVIGMINKGHAEKEFKKIKVEKKFDGEAIQGIFDLRQGITFAISIETIWESCPPLKPAKIGGDSLVEGINQLPYDYAKLIQNFLDEYRGTEQHPMPFGGRDDDLHTLDKWLDGRTPYLLLAAPAGRGKSALLVRWLDNLRYRNDLALAFFPISIRFGTNMGRVLYATLAARLAFLHAEGVPTSSETSTDVYRGLVSRYLSEPLADGRKLLVVVDGLDEASDWTAGADFLPSQLPTGVHVAVSARFLAGDDDAAAWLDRLNWGKGRAIAPKLDVLSRAGVADVLEKMGAPINDLSRDVDIVAALYRLSEGDPLLVRLYMDDLWSRGAAAARLKLKDLAEIQPGYKGYFDAWWEHQKSLWGRDKKTWLEGRVRTVRKFLAGALSPLHVDDLQALDPNLPSDDIREALDELKRFVIGSDQVQGYTFSHPKLGQYFWEELTVSERQQVERQFLAWGKLTLQEFISGERNSKKKAHVPVYVMRNYTTHLLKAERPIEEWLPLIHYEQWAQAWHTAEGAYSGYLQDVQRVWMQCKLLDHQTIVAGGSAAWLGEQIRCGLIEASLHSLADNIPSNLIPVLVQTGLWTLAQAWVLIRQMPDDIKKSNAINELLRCLDDTQFLEAFVAAREISEEGSRARVLSALVQPQRLPETALGEILSAAREIRSEGSRARVLSALAQHLPETALGEILSAAREIRSEGSRARVLSALAQRLPELAGEALAVAREIRPEDDRANVLSTLAQRLPETVLGEILSAAREIRSEGSRTRVLSALAQRLPELAEEALAAAREISDEKHRASVLSALAQHLPETALEEILSAAWEISDEEACASVLSVLTQRLPELVGAALTTAREIRSERLRASVLSALAQHLPETALGEILAAAREIRSERPRASVLSALSQRLPELAGEALAAAREIRDETYHASVLSALAQHLPELTGEALATAWKIRSEGDRARVLSDLAQHLPETALGEILAAAREIRSEKPRANLLSDLSLRLPETARGEIFAATREIRSEGSRVRVLIALAQRLPEAGLEEILSAAREIRSEGFRANIFSALAQRLPEAALGEIFAAAREIRHEWSRASVLSALAQRLPEAALGELFAVARTIRFEGPRASVLSALAQRLPETALGEMRTEGWEIRSEKHCASILSALAQRLPETALGEILIAVREIRSEKHRARVLSELAQRMPELAGEALAATWEIRAEGSRTRVLSVLAQHLPETALGEMRAAVREIRSERPRASVLSVLAQHLPETALGEILSAARKISDEKPRASVLSALAQRLPELTGEALAAAREISNAGDRANVLSNLAQPLMLIPKMEGYKHLETTLSQLALRTRPDFSSDLVAWLPVLLHLGATGLDWEIFQSVQDVSVWWP